MVALVGWAIAEFKYKAFTFTRSEKDIEEEAELEEQRRADGFKEMNIRDIMRKNSTNGFSLAKIASTQVPLGTTSTS